MRISEENKYKKNPTITKSKTLKSRAPNEIRIMLKTPNDINKNKVR